MIASHCSASLLWHRRPLRTVRGGRLHGKDVIEWTALDRDSDSVPVWRIQDLPEGQKLPKRCKMFKSKQNGGRRYLMPEHFHFRPKGEGGEMGKPRAERMRTVKKRNRFGGAGASPHSQHCGTGIRTNALAACPTFPISIGISLRDAACST